MVETSRLFARTVASIDSGWLETAGGGLCRASFRDPRWDPQRGEVVATEQVTLFGLVIVPARTVSYGRGNPDAATDIFIRQALVAGELGKPAAFLKHNQAMAAKIWRSKAHSPPGSAGQRGASCRFLSPADFGGL